MIKTIHIDDSDNKAQALLAYLRTLDFVKIEEEADSSDFVLTEKHLEILEERRKNHIEGKSESYSWEEVKKSLGKERITKQ